MNYRNLGSSGLKISTIGLGSWLTMGKAIDQKVSDSLVGTALDCGVNFFDTADIYNFGEGEVALGKALQGRKRETLVIASKCFFPMSGGVNDRGLSRKHVWESLHDSLKRIGTDYLDLYWQREKTEGWGHAHGLGGADLGCFLRMCWRVPAVEGEGCSAWSSTGSRS